MKKFFNNLLVVFLMLFMVGCSTQESQPQNDSVPSDEQLARNTLVVFLNDLHNGKYGEAATLYDGSYEIIMEFNPEIPPDDPASLLRNACLLNGYQCLKVKSIAIGNKESDIEFVFDVDFLNEDGTPFSLNSCCGSDNEDLISQSVFSFTVIEVDPGRFAVMNMPPYLP